ncbi:MAG: AbrB family transcriptional regulator [Cyanobacteria bacterium P01_H01_bin.121]
MTETAKKVLSGKELLQKVQSMNGKRREIAIACGYTSKNGKADLAKFYEALLSAKGVQIDNGSAPSRRGREATYRATVQKNGQILIGAAYTKEMGLKPGTEFKLKLGYKHIHLIPVDAEDDAE